MKPGRGGCWGSGSGQPFNAVLSTAGVRALCGPMGEERGERVHYGKAVKLQGGVWGTGLSKSLNGLDSEEGVLGGV